MEPQKINIDNSLFGKPDLPEGLCKFEHNTWGPNAVESIIYYKSYGLMNFAFVARAEGCKTYVGRDYARRAGFFQEYSSTAHILTTVLGTDMFKASKEEIMYIFITKKHHMSDWLLFNQELWNK